MEGQARQGREGGEGSSPTGAPAVQPSSCHLAAWRVQPCPLQPCLANSPATDCAPMLTLPAHYPCRLSKPIMPCRAGRPGTAFRNRMHANAETPTGAPLLRNRGAAGVGRNLLVRLAVLPGPAGLPLAVCTFPPGHSSPWTVQTRTPCPFLLLQGQPGHVLPASVSNRLLRLPQPRNFSTRTGLASPPCRSCLPLPPRQAFPVSPIWPAQPARRSRSSALAV